MSTEEPTPPAVPMVKEAVVKEDGRNLYYYTFPAEPAGGEGTPEDADV